jgi:hypothetical protein
VDKAAAALNGGIENAFGTGLPCSTVTADSLLN